MGFELSLISGAFDNTLMHRQAVNEVMNSNALTARYGLILAEPQALALVETRTLSLRDDDDESHMQNKACRSRFCIFVFS